MFRVLRTGRPMAAPTQTRVVAALAVVYVVWGSTYLAIRYAVGVDDRDAGIPPLLMAAIRFLVAGALMLAVTARRQHPDGDPDPIGHAQWRSTAIVGVALLLGGNGGVVLAEHRGVATGVAAVVVATLPLWIALIAWARGDERLTFVGQLGLLLGFSGVVVLANPFGADHIDLVGAALLLLASLSWACGSYYARTAELPRRPLVATGMEMLCGGGALLLCSAVRGDLTAFHPSRVSTSAWLGVAYLVTFGSLLAFTTYVWLLRHVRLSLVSTYAYVNPVVAVVAGAIVLDEAVTGRTLVASSVIVAGVALMVSAGQGSKRSAGAEVLSSEVEPVA